MRIVKELVGKEVLGTDVVIMGKVVDVDFDFDLKFTFEELRNQLGYSNLHETVKLCDTVTVKYPDLGVNIKTQIVKTVYDSL